MIAALALLLLAGCSEGPNGGREPIPYEVTLPDGRVVMCVAVDVGGLDCEFDG